MAAAMTRKVVAGCKSYRGTVHVQWVWGRGCMDERR